MENWFAKIFLVEGDNQVLVFNEYNNDEEEDKHEVHIITQIDGITAHAKVSFSGEDQDKHSNKYLKNYTQQDADKFYAKMAEMLGCDDGDI
jgi:hypothetical protein